ncbi:hypothetical protein Cgig2_014975 [Carnegiea gigantea]|uniref:Uncharacterized protein n=1 Tax=Carnegiea gigantea TaxID=171969 RepID=A0A9Q1JW19_9CARY|nr:hypothetical protein Cgig2_014975 [Carnegiea gigantea]
MEEGHIPDHPRGPNTRHNQKHFGHSLVGLLTKGGLYILKNFSIVEEQRTMALSEDIGVVSANLCTVESKLEVWTPGPIPSSMLLHSLPPPRVAEFVPHSVNLASLKSTCSTTAKENRAEVLDLLSFLPFALSPSLHLHQPDSQFSAFNYVLILKRINLPCTLVLPQITISLCTNPGSFLTNSQFPHEWLFRDVDFLAHPYNYVVLAGKFVNELRLLVANEGCEAHICKFGRYWCARVLGSIIVFLESVSSECQIVKLQSATDNDATRHHETQISLLFLSSSLYHSLFYPSLPQFLPAYLSYDDIKFLCEHYNHLPYLCAWNEDMSSSLCVRREMELDISFSMATSLTTKRKISHGAQWATSTK